jgi:ABC-type nitrate/sulfonate/bicarbonate transport system permease component
MSIFETFVQSSFLRPFCFMLLQIAVAFLVGSWLGVRLGGLVPKVHWLMEGFIRFFRIAQWVPFFVYWALPVWPPRPGYQYDPIVWAWLGSLVAVTLCASYNYLISTAAELDSSAIRSNVKKQTILRAFLYTFVAQVWIGDYGWLRSFGPWVGGIKIGFAAAVFYIFLLLIVEKMLGPIFTQTRHPTTSTSMDSVEHARLWALISGIWFTFMIIWYLFSKPLKTYFSLAPPLVVLQSAYNLLVHGDLPMSAGNSSVWLHILISLAEVLIGLGLALVLAFLIWRLTSVHSALGRWIPSLLPITYLLPIMLSLFLINLGIVTTSVFTITAVASLSFFPCAQAFWKLDNNPLSGRLLHAAEKALPFAFVAMFFGEAWNATAGVGFLMVILRTDLHTLQYGIAVSLIALILFGSISGCLRWMRMRIARLA